MIYIAILFQRCFRVC